MPTYDITVGDKSEHNKLDNLRWDEEIVKVEVVPFFDNNIMLDNEQHPVMLSHYNIIYTTEYTAKPGTSVNPYTGPPSTRPIQGPMTLEQQLAFNAALLYRRPASHYHSNRVGSTVKSSSPNGPKKMKKKKRAIPSCPPGFRYDFKSRTCVKIKGRKRYATKKKFRNNKRR